MGADSDARTRAHAALRAAFLRDCASSFGLEADVEMAFDNLDDIATAIDAATAAPGTTPGAVVLDEVTKGRVRIHY